MTALRRRSTRILPQKLCATQCCLSARDSQRNFFRQIQPVGSGCPATVAHRDGDIGTKVRWRYGTAVVRRRDPFSETKAPASANNTLLRIATIRRGTIELMQNAASTASAAEYPTISIHDIAVRAVKSGRRLHSRQSM